MSLFWSKLTPRGDLTDDSRSRDVMARDESCLSLFLRTDRYPWTTANLRYPPTLRRWIEPSTSEHKPRVYMLLP